jgi:hypothetical protein
MSGSQAIYNTLGVGPKLDDKQVRTFKHRQFQKLQIQRRALRKQRSILQGVGEAIFGVERHMAKTDEEAKAQTISEEDYSLQLEQLEWVKMKYQGSLTLL